MELPESCPCLEMSDGGARKSLLHWKWLKSRPESGLDWHICPKFARQRIVLADGVARQAGRPHADELPGTEQDLTLHFFYKIVLQKSTPAHFRDFFLCISQNK